jgi:hypothetical protein
MTSVSDISRGSTVRFLAPSFALPETLVPDPGLCGPWAREAVLHRNAINEAPAMNPVTCRRPIARITYVDELGAEMPHFIKA